MDDTISTIVEEHLSGSGGFTRHYLLLYSVILGMEAKKVLEIGAGFSSRVILAALERTGGDLLSCDNRSVQKKGLSEIMNRYAAHWTYHVADSRDFLKTLGDQTFDVVLHDGAHDFRNIVLDLRRIVPRMKKNAVILIHDTFHPGLQRRLLGLAVRIGLFPHRYEMVTLPYGCGLSIVRVKSNFGNGTVEIRWTKSAAEATQFGASRAKQQG